jgi:hypothetical protein
MASSTEVLILPAAQVVMKVAMWALRSAASRVQKAEPRILQVMKTALLQAMSTMMARSLCEVAWGLVFRSRFYVFLGSFQPSTKTLRCQLCQRVLTLLLPGFASVLAG